MLKIGLTGNIGCGKSSISNQLEKKGHYIIDADLITREIYADENVIKEMLGNFPDSFENGKICRKKLGSIVFEDNEKLKLLNSITHKAIKLIVEKRIKAIEEDERYKSKAIVIDAALLYEANFSDIVDKTIVVYCSPEEQLKRVVKRDNISEEDAIKKINSQMDQKIKIERSDYVVDNSYSRETLEESISALLKKIEEWIIGNGGN
ncbi:dephospho-CoA kinase [Peptostreptococcus faecalis]|uniref:dephospho-CoA kinase n=1 Tax=Peptostreptococcus faecalis TaxID=2045015 RepID=UPI000C7BA5E2|nr:dephospho-CoA kinase [Peptostreptococcus faecalis]